MLEPEEKNTNNFVEDVYKQQKLINAVIECKNAMEQNGEDNIKEAVPKLFSVLDGEGKLSDDIINYSLVIVATFCIKSIKSENTLFLKEILKNMSTSLVKYDVDVHSFLNIITINDSGDEKTTLLDYAIEIGNLDSVKMLVENGASFDIMSLIKNNPLFQENEKLNNIMQYLIGRELPKDKFPYEESSDTESETEEVCDDVTSMGVLKEMGNAQEMFCANFNPPLFGGDVDYYQ